MFAAREKFLRFVLARATKSAPSTKIAVGKLDVLYAMKPRECTAPGPSTVVLMRRLRNVGAVSALSGYSSPYRSDLSPARCILHHLAERTNRSGERMPVLPCKVGASAFAADPARPHLESPIFAFRRFAARSQSAMPARCNTTLQPGNCQARAIGQRARTGSSVR